MTYFTNSLPQKIYLNEKYVIKIGKKNKEQIKRQASAIKSCLYRITDLIFTIYQTQYHLLINEDYENIQYDHSLQYPTSLE